MTNTTQPTVVKQQVVEAIEHLLSLFRWCSECPFESDGVYECMANKQSSLEDAIQDMIEQTGDEALIEGISAMTEEGDFGEPWDSMQDPATAFWTALMHQAAEQPEAPHNEGRE